MLPQKRALDELSEDEKDQWDLSPEEADIELQDYLIQQYAGGKMNAKQVCTIAFLGVKAGVGGLGSLAVPPDSGSGNFARHLNAMLKKLDSKVPDGYSVPIPAYNGVEGVRETHLLQMLVPHEMLVAELDSYNLQEKLNEFEEDAVPAYWCHPVKLVAGDEPTIPVALFFDGVEYSGSDSLIA
eukprot:1269807-Amphidinium_carterae.1